MELQQINYEFNPPHQLILQHQHQQSINTKQQTQFNAQKRLRQLSKYIYTNFTPYKQFFNNKSNHITLFQGKPQFYLHSYIHDRQRLSLERQSMYYRGAVDEYLTDQFLKDFVEQTNSQKGFINKKRNKSIVIEGAVYYAHENCIKAIQLPKIRQRSSLQIYQQSINPLQIISLQKGSIILELQKIQNHMINSIYEGVILLARLSRKVLIVSVKQRKIVQTIQTSTQFIQINLPVYKKNTLQTIEYDGINSILQTYQINSKQKLQKKIQQSIKIQKLVNSKININKNQILLTKYEGLYLLDKRIRKQIKLYKSQNVNKQRFYNSIPLKGFYNYSPLIASCQSRYISLFDIRKNDSLIKKYYHQCQQAPPEIMNFYDGTYHNPLIQPILTCHSPYQMGSSIFMSINLNSFQELKDTQNKQFQFLKNQITNNKFKLLFDCGKSSQGAGFQGFYNESISICNYSLNQFSVIKINNQGSIDAEYFLFNQFNQKYQEQKIKQQKQFFTQNQNNLNQFWFEQNLKDKFLRKQKIYQVIEIEIQNQNSQAKLKKKKSQKQKKKKSDKLEKKNSQLKQPLTQVDIEDILEGEYQNSSECSQSLPKRKINIANLSQFQFNLQSKAINSAPQVEKKANQIDFSLNSTQPNSQGYIFSQAFSDDNATKTLNFHNKKFMNFTILQKLKNEWDN